MRTALLSWTFVAIACAAAPHRSEPATPATKVPEPTAPAPARADPLAEVAAVLAGIELTESYRGTADLVLALDRAGLTESLAIDAMAACLDPDDVPAACTRVAPSTYDALARWLGDRGSARALAVLYAHKSRGDSYVAGMALDAALVRQMTAAQGPCAPPTDDAIATQHADLDGFAVIDATTSGFVARPPTTAERDDLAYFLAAVRHAGPEVAAELSEHHSGIEPPAAAVAQREAWMQEIEAARKVGDLATVQQRGVAYLRSLGYPGALDMSAEESRSWGGMRASDLTRDLALTSEIVGETDLAADLYHRANPGGGGCGTSVGYRWRRQVEGFIRTRERRSGCTEVVAQRLLDVGGDRSEESPYGPARLAVAGFDLARLYRGALVTRNRDVDEAVLVQTLARMPGAHGERARRRLVVRGPEAWEARVRAIEGIADELDRPGVEHLASALDGLGTTARTRAISAIGRAAYRTSVGPCEGDWFLFHGFGFGGRWERAVSAFGTNCATRLSDDEAERLSGRLVAHLDDTDPEVRAAVLDAMGSIAAPSARRRVARALARVARTHTRCSAAEAAAAADPDSEAEAEPECDAASIVHAAAERALADIESR